MRIDKDTASDKGVRLASALGKSTVAERSFVSEKGEIVKKALLIINPGSRSGADAQLEEGLQLLKDAGIEVLQEGSTSAAHLGELIEQYQAQVDLIIIGGGDGTVSSAAAHLYCHKKPFAILPLGTANDLARSLDIPNDIVEACRIITLQQRRRIDLGVVNGHYFFNVAHIGLGVNITYALTPEAKKAWGVFSYLKAFFQAFSNSETFSARLQVDGRLRRIKSIHLAVGNGRYYGGGNVVDENAAVDSGELCLYSLKPQSLWALITLAPLLRGGKHRYAKRVHSDHGKRIEIKTSTPMEVHADGEPVGYTPALFEILPGALQVCAPLPISAELPLETIEEPNDHPPGEISGATSGKHNGSVAA